MVGAEGREEDARRKLRQNEAYHEIKDVELIIELNVTISPTIISTRHRLILIESKCSNEASSPNHSPGSSEKTKSALSLLMPFYIRALTSFRQDMFQTVSIVFVHGLGASPGKT